MKLTTLNLYCAILVIAGLSASCKKNISADDQETGSEALSSIGPVQPYTWTQLAIPGNINSYPFNQEHAPVITVPVGDTYYCWTGGSLEKLYVFNKTTKRWQAHPGFETGNDLFSRYKPLFAYNSKVFFGLGDADPGFFGELDPIVPLGQRTNMARFPGADSVGVPISYVVGENGYLFFGGGYGKFWRYNFPTDTWTMIGESPLGKRYYPTIVVVGNQVYAGLGWEVVNFGGQEIRVYKRDWKVFTPGSGWMAAKADFPGDLRSNTQQFVIGDNIYVGFGIRFTTNGTVRYNDVWKFNTDNNTWVRITDWPGTRSPVMGPYDNISAFGIGNSGYVVTGGLNQFWRYSNQPLIVAQN